MPATATPVLTRACVNEGGPGSLIRLEGSAIPERRTALAREGFAALQRWQARPGEILSVVDATGMVWRARLVEVGADRAFVVPFAGSGPRPEASVALEVYQALPDKERFELVLEKLTELGAARIVPYVSARSATLAERDAGQKKSHRWPHVVRRAARQCRRPMLPELAPVLSWEQVLEESSGADLRLLLYEGDALWMLREALLRETPGRVALLVGPEGGFTAAEVEVAQARGVLPVSLGPRILRTETAAIVAAAIIQYHLGELG